MRVIQVIIDLLIGWDQKKIKGSNGIFGIPQAYTDCRKKRARFTLHSHIPVRIENLNETRKLLFHESKTSRQEA